MCSLRIPPQEPSKEITRDRRRISLAVLIVVALTLAVIFFYPKRGSGDLLHVSYDASRDFYADLNLAFEQAYQEKSDSRILMNHAGSVRQIRNLTHGQIADVVSLSSAFDLKLALGNQFDPSTEETNNQLASPFYSSIALVVRSGNPKRISNWEDLWRSDIRVAIPSPNRSGAGRWALLALYRESIDLSPPDSSDLISLQDLYLRSEIIDGGSRFGLENFASRRHLDAFLTWESDALELQALGFRNLEAVYFPRSILAQPQITAMLRYTDQRGTTDFARDYLDFHFGEQGQRIAANHHLRPSDLTIQRSFAEKFPSTQLYTIESVVPEGVEIWQTVFGNNGLFQNLESLRAARRGGSE